jgi:hypothetical protein
MLVARFASAKPAQCFHTVDVKTNIDNRFRDGFTIGAAETSQSEREMRND